MQRRSDPPAPDVAARAGEHAGGKHHDRADANLQAILFDADGDDRRLGEEEIDLSMLSARRLLWIDVEDDDEHDAAPVLARLIPRLQLDAGADVLNDLNGRPRLHNYGDWFLVQVIAVEHEGGLRFGGRGLAIVCGRNFVLSLHRGPLEILDQLRDREHAETRIGTLSAESFTASLLDWQVDSYLHAVSDFEAAVDRLEVSVLASRIHHECLPELAQLRRGASRLRRMLAPHRHVFGALARPDFRPDDGEQVGKQFHTLEQRFERAMDAVEVARELVVGSFELFTTRSAQRTNDTMRVLTFVTVLLGSLAVVAGALGMNFKAPFFDTGAQGFWISIAVMAVFTAAATAFARWRRWF